MAPKKATTPAKAATPAKEEEKKKEADDPKKRKAEETKADAAPKKEAKKETKKEAEAEGAEKEKDAPVDKRPTVKETVGFAPNDTTLNVLPTLGGKVLMSLSEGGMQYLIAGARANVGISAGRYMFEVRIVEALNPAESSTGQRGRVPMPRQLVRLGFSTANSALVLGDSEQGIHFDSEGAYVSGKGKKAAVSQRFTRDQVISVLLNLDPKSPNHNTLSIFREGERISEPQPIPEHLHGKPLFPHVAFRGVTVQVHFGPVPLKALPFSCCMVQGAAQADAAVSPMVQPKDGRYEVMMPVAFPDEGTFDWLDMFLEANPHYVELSDRKILEWAASSGLWKPKGGGWKTSNDKPEFNFGLPGMDDFSIRRVINSVAPAVPRNYVIMEVKSNLITAERKEVLARFSTPSFKKVAKVVMGEPNEEYKSKQLERLRKEKQEKADAEWKAKKAEEERKKQVEQKQKQLQEMRRKADEQRKKFAEDAKKKREEEAKKKEAEKKAKEAAEKKAAGGEEAQEAEEEPKAEEAEVKEEETKGEETPASMEVEAPKEEEAKEEPKEEEEEKKDEEMAEEKPDEGPPQVELTEEEKKMWFRPASTGATTDLTPSVLSQSFASFSLPEASEGFDDVSYEWQDAESSGAYLRKWVLDRKLTSRIEDLEPGRWFQDKVEAWIKTHKEWQAKQKEYQSSAAKKAKEEEKKKRQEGDDEGAAEMEGDDIDIFSVEDVCNVGDGEPLFSNFSSEDWALLQLRFDLYFLQLAFKKDVDDPERIGIHETHLNFYYNKYCRKQLNPKHFGVATNTDVCKLIKDTVAISEDTQVLTSPLQEDMESVDMLLKLTEESRRERQRRIDAGDETAKLKFSPIALQGPAAPKTIPAGARATGAWSGQARPTGQTWQPAARPGFQPAQRWPQQTQFAPRAPSYQQKWR